MNTSPKGRFELPIDYKGYTSRLTSTEWSFQLHIDKISTREDKDLLELSLGVPAACEAADELTEAFLSHYKVFIALLNEDVGQPVIDGCGFGPT